MDYKPNSHRFKEERQAERKTIKEREKVEKVIKGTAKTRKKSGLSKLTDAIIPEDINDVKSYILMDVIVPVVKDAICDTVNVLLWGDTKRGKRPSMSSKVSYRSFYDNNRGSSSGSENFSRARSAYGFENVVVDSRAEAEEILTRMGEIMDTYDGIVSVADMYDLAGISCNYTDNKYGWTNIRNAKVTRVRDGWMIEMPKALPL